jgi:transposase-like protein
VQVRTKEPLEEQGLSEVTPGSDKRASGRVHIVRSHPGFGQKSRWKIRICPKSPRVQTKQPLEEQKLSEVTPGSDKRASGRVHFVRSHPSFRQNSRWKNRNCPKSPQVQTKQPMEEQNLSEVTPGSDKIAGGRAEFVRSRPGFRQKSRWKSRNCLKSPRVRTKQPLEEQGLSEVTPGSDKTAGGRTEIVRSHPGFGQNSRWKNRNCPKSPRVQTKQPVKEQNLTEV